MSEKIYTEINSWIAEYGNERDALNVALAKIKHLEAQLHELTETHQETTESDPILGIRLRCMTCKDWHYERESCIRTERIRRVG